MLECSYSLEPSACSAVARSEVGEVWAAMIWKGWPDAGNINLVLTYVKVATKSFAPSV
jgi:hypothetical protein